VRHIVREPANAIGLDNLAPHDLRPTCARLCHASGGELEQIQFLLEHVSVQTTERYLGCKQRIQSAVNDRIGIEPFELGFRVMEGWRTNHPERPRPLFGLNERVALILPTEHGKASFRKPTTRQTHYDPLNCLCHPHTFQDQTGDHMDAREADFNCRVVPKVPDSQHLRGLPRRVTHEVYLTSK
jgi:hypothetical protein